MCKCHRLLLDSQNSSSSSYSEMTNATQQRGNYLDDLGESLNNVSMSAANYVSQARNAAVSRRCSGLTSACHCYY